MSPDQPTSGLSHADSELLMRNCMDHWEEHRLRPILEEYVKKIVFEKLVESWKPYMAGIRWLYGAILASAAIAVLNLIFGIVKTP